MINTIIVRKKLYARVLYIYVYRKSKHLLHVTSVKLAVVLDPCSDAS